MIRAALLLSLVIPLGAAAPEPLAAKPEKRCGWLENPTPANWWLLDRDGQWIIGSQGGHQARGMENIPNMAGRNWIVTNGTSYGRGCACMTVEVNRRESRITRISAVKQLPLATCRADRTLPKPTD
ncbi:DUF4087 domain-containing protein [Sphingomonas sp. G-3-2-10]|uniref:DUF4087 domain-containing protein n=1 Tax=Sphingomonas sp. G-3-2-10 TaxID=2728838 RepID=UPI00146BF768|nr:DUF4087 domain-containing protein [Sphingomonas sp. G-3-2-10]NML06718.1 DUF4087 domain-containing protein [Sphingomonas sp. G-3-2-10]